MQEEAAEDRKECWMGRVEAELIGKFGIEGDEKRRQQVCGDKDQGRYGKLGRGLQASWYMSSVMSTFT